MSKNERSFTNTGLDSEPSANLLRLESNSKNYLGIHLYCCLDRFRSRHRKTTLPFESLHETWISKYKGNKL